VTPLEDLLTRVRRDVAERRAKCNQFDGARQLFNPATWAQEATTVYEFVRPLEEYGLTNMAMILFKAIMPPSYLLIHPSRMEAYLDLLTSGTIQIPPGNFLGSYEDILAKDTPPHPTLIIVENGNELLDHLQARGKCVGDFYQWSVGFFPLPKLHTHLIFQPA
jgi:hypothetical protein